MAWVAHVESQLIEQQMGSSSHTQFSQEVVSQPGNTLAPQQSLPGLQPHSAWHATFASFMQEASHWKSQHVLSMSQTHSSHAVFPQPGVPLVSLQQSIGGSVAHPHAFVHVVSAVMTQSVSHATEQQNASSAHTQSWHSRLPHPGFPNPLAQQFPP